MLPKASGASWCGRACRALLKLTQVSEHHPLTFHHFRSYPVMVAERQRHIFEGGRGTIHPFSKFRSALSVRSILSSSLVWNSFMVFVNLTHMVVSSLRLCYYLNPPDRAQYLVADYILLGLHMLCLTDMVVRFNTGYLEGSPAIVILNRQSIASHYLRLCFALDLASCLPLSFLFITLGHRVHYCFLISHSLPVIFRAFRIWSVVIHLRTLLKMMTKSIIAYRVTRHFLVLTLVTHWLTCLVYLPPIIHYYCYGYIPSGYNEFLALQGQSRSIAQVSVAERYLKALFISVSSLFGTGFSIFRVKFPAEILVNSIIILLASMCMIYNADKLWSLKMVGIFSGVFFISLVFFLVFLLVTYMIIFNSSMRYQELMDQVEKYMRHKQFPAELKRRVRAYYDYRYQERYFKEETALNCLSEQLRNELSLHNCQMLLDKVSLFDSLPPTFIGSLLGCLKPEVYLPNDLIVRAGDFGDCMYFLSSGTVAVYSSEGAEVCHLEDGEFFGALALMMKDRKRFATVVAVEITQLYRLDADDFYGFIMDNQELFNRIESELTERINKTALADDVHRREREWLASTGRRGPAQHETRISSATGIQASPSLKEPQE